MYTVPPDPANAGIAMLYVVPVNAVPVAIVNGPIANVTVPEDPPPVKPAPAVTPVMLEAADSTALKSAEAAVPSLIYKVVAADPSVLMN